MKVRQDTGQDICDLSVKANKMSNMGRSKVGMEVNEECMTANVQRWETLLNLIASEQMNTDRTGAPEVETMSYYLSNPRIKALLTEWVSKMHYTHAKKQGYKDSALKCDFISIAWRQIGNDLYTKPNGPVDQAYVFYQWSVVFAESEGPALALALANRSAALARLKRYKECLSDIAWALKLHYPNDHRQKLLLRRADCYVELGFEEEAKESMRQAIVHAASVTLSPNAAADFATTVKQVELKLRSSRIIARDNVVLRQPVLGYNDTFVHASNALQLARGEEDVGRHVVSRNKVSRGDVLFSETPYACVALSGVGPICETCCATNINIVPCTVCTRVAFCSFACRERGEILFHRWECVGFQSEILHTIGIAHLALRVMLMMTNESFPIPFNHTPAIEAQLAIVAKINAQREKEQSFASNRAKEQAQASDQPMESNKPADQPEGSTDRNHNQPSVSNSNQPNTPNSIQSNEAPGVSTGAIRKTKPNKGHKSKNRSRTAPCSGLAGQSNGGANIKSTDNNTPYDDDTYSVGVLRKLLTRAKDLDENNGEKTLNNKLIVQAEELFASYELIDNIEIYKKEFPPMYRMFNLVTNFKKMSSRDFSQYCATAAVLTHYLDIYTAFFEFLPHQLAYALSDIQLRVFTAAVLLRSIGQLINNGHAATTLVTEKRRDHEVRRATAIYPSTAMLNHSCDPDVVNNFYKNRLIVRAAREVPAGVTVSNCYGPHYARMPHETRQNVLRAQYGFYCHCLACSDDDKKDFAKLFSAYACHYCKAPLQSTVLQCNHCKKSVSFDVRRDLIERADELSAEAEKFKKVSATCEAEQVAMKNRQKAFHRHHTELREHADYLARLENECGHFTKAIELIKQNVQSAEYQFGSFSSEVANELRKLSNVMMNRLNETGSTSNPNYRDWCLEAHKVLRKAVVLMEHNYGHWEPLVKRLQEQESYVADRLAGMRSPEEDHDLVESVHYNMHYNLKI